MKTNKPATELLKQARGAIAAAMGQGMVTAAWARFLPDHRAVLSEDGDRTFAQLNARTNQLVRALRARGLGAGDGLAVMSRNRPEFVEAIHAARRAGLRVTPVNWHLTGAEAGYIVDDCDAKALIADAHFADAAMEAAACAPKATVRLSVGGEIPGFERYDDALADQAPEDIDDPVLGGAMLYTSGTTGRPKGVARDAPGASPAGGMAASGMAANPLAAMQSYEPGRSVHLVTGPLYHSAPLAFSLMMPHLFGSAVLLMNRWDTEGTLRLIQEHGVSHAHMVPTMFHRLLSLSTEVREQYDLSTLRYLIHGAAPCPVHVKKRLIEWLGPIVHEYYAATEGVGTMVDSHTWLKKPGTIGKPATADHIKIMDDEGRALPPGEIGYIYIKAPGAARFAYHKDQDKTDSAYRGEYFTLRDVGYLDADGFLFLTDRSTELIISGGVNIYPAEIESVLLSSPHVADVAVIGVPNPEWGEEVKAIVQPSERAVPSPELADELVALCQRELAKYKCPRSVDFAHVLPRSEAGKLQKHVLREQYREQTTGS